MGQLFLIAGRSLLQHKIRTFLIGAAIAFVTALLLILTGISTGMRDTMLESATTLMTGHVNVAGFYKVTAGQSAPVVTQYKKVLELVKKEVPELDYVAQRGRGWAKLVSDTGSIQVGIGGIDITNEPGFKRVIVPHEGKLDDLAKPNAIMIFEEQAKKLGVKVGDTMTLSAPTFRGTNNTVDVTLVCIANNVGLMSSWNVFMHDATLRALYQLNDDTTGALQLYLKDLKDVAAVQGRLRTSFAKNGFAIMDDDPRAFWMKFETVNRENWTGQKLDITNWEDEISFMKWTVTALTGLSVVVTVILLFIICVGIMNIMWITIRERTREIGTLRAIGMQRTGVLSMFLTEGFLLGLCGTGLGAVVGLLVSAGLNAAQVPVPLGVQLFLMTDRLVLTPTVGWVIFAVVFITFCITAISLIPSFLAARMKPVTAMHHIG
jgi:putative ABC transport system permease protein